MMKQSSKLAILGISVSIIIFLGILPPQTIAHATKKKYWPSWDRWRETSPEAQGMDSSVIEAMYDYIYDNQINVHSVLIVRNGYIVNEEYLYEYERLEEKSYYWPEADPFFHLRDGRLHCLWSVTKSVVSLLTGIAIEMELFDLDTKFFDVFPDRWDPDKYGDPVFDDAKKDITVENMLLQNAGIQWDELGNSWWAWFLTDFSLDHYLTQPMIYEPGADIDTAFTYSGGNAEMISVMIAEKTGMTMAQFARKYLFKPLKIRDTEWEWWEGPSEWGTGATSTKTHGGFGLFMTHRAMARIGLMCLNGGKWRGRQVVPEEWIEESTSVQIVRHGGTVQYGYLWWPKPNYYKAIGYAGQRIIVIPEYDIVVAITADEYYDVWGLYEHIIDEFIMNAVVSID